MISDAKRKEITEWATKEALKEAKRLGREPGKRERNEINYDAWLQAQIWHYEKKAYLKIQKREAGKQ